MAKASDYLLDSKGNLLIANGDFVVGDSDKQHIKDNINAGPGWWKQYPDDGVGIAMYQKSRVDVNALSAKIRTVLESDGYTVYNPTVKIVNGRLKINPDAVRL